MNYERKFYENDALWNDASLVNSEISRIVHTYNLIPRDVASIMDVGCGNGLFLNYLKNNYSNKFHKLQGIDTSEAALKYVTTNKLCASADAIPFKDKSFDLVTALEVIEHLTIDEYKKALKELSRVSRKYIIISVPYKQNLSDISVRCDACKSCFNLAFHKRIFSESSLTDLFLSEGFKNIKLSYYGKIENMLLLTPVYRFFKKIYPPPIKIDTPCPICGFKIEAARVESKKFKIFNKTKFVAKMIRPVWPKIYMPKWILAVYQKLP